MKNICPEILRNLTATFATQVLQQQEAENATDLSLQELRETETANSTTKMTGKNMIIILSALVM